MELIGLMNFLIVFYLTEIVDFAARIHHSPALWYLFPCSDFNVCSMLIGRVFMIVFMALDLRDVP